MKKGGSGGAKTQKAGADFEFVTASKFESELVSRGFTVLETHKLSGDNGPLHGITFEKPNKKKVEVFYQDGLYRLFFQPRNVKWQDFFSARLKPDTAIFSNDTNTLTIIEKKQQTGPGSVMEKLQTCDYKMLYYSTLANQIGVKVDIVWQLGSHFVEQQNGLKSVFEYMKSKGSRYFFLEIPPEELKI